MKTMNMNFKHNQLTLFFVADVHSQKHHFLVSIKETRTILKEFIVENSTTGFIQFITLVKLFSAKFRTQNVIFAFEPTSVYWMNFAYAFYQDISTSFLNKQILFVSPEIVAYQRKVDDPAGNKDDHKDPLTISKLVWDNKTSKAILLPEKIFNLRELTRQRNSLVKIRSSLKTQLRNKIIIIFPELLNIFSDILTASARYVISNFTTPENITKLPIQTFTQFLLKISKKKLSTHKIELLYSYAQSSLGIKGNKNGLISNIKYILEQIELYDKLISQIENEIEYYLKSIPQTLTQIKGISTILAASIIAEIFPISRFSNSSQLVKYAGIDPTHSTSGISLKKLSYIAKKGDVYLRLLIIQTAFSCINHNQYIKRYYTNLINYGHKPKRVAIVAVANKLLRIIFNLLKYNIKFDPSKIGMGPKKIVEVVPFKFKQNNFHSLEKAKTKFLLKEKASEKLF